MEHRRIMEIVDGSVVRREDTMRNNTACPRCGGKSTYASPWRGVYCQVQCGACGWHHIVESWTVRVDLEAAYK